VSKLVRDRIPDVIRESGREPEITHVKGEDLKIALKDKLVEEALELRDTERVEEELADVLEVVDAIIRQYGINREHLETIKKEKHDLRGGFTEGHYLITND
jgi:predicted house-cleaning noncanonical NTP pyrophosphatase (MazG superfamily)